MNSFNQFFFILFCLLSISWNFAFSGEVNWDLLYNNPLKKQIQELEEQIPELQKQYEDFVQRDKMANEDLPWQTMRIWESIKMEICSFINFRKKTIPSAGVAVR